MYKTVRCSRSSRQLSLQAGADVPRISTAGFSNSAKDEVLKKQLLYEKIGTIPEGDSNIIRIRSSEEDVIDYEFTSLTTLVHDEELRGHLQQAIQHYISLNSPTKRK